MMIKYFKYRKKVALPGIKDIVKNLEEESKVRIKKLDDAAKNLNLKQLDMGVDTLNDIEALEELLKYLIVGFDVYNDYILRIRNPYARQVFKELREGIFKEINMLEGNVKRLISVPLVEQEVYPVE